MKNLINNKKGLGLIEMGFVAGLVAITVIMLAPVGVDPSPRQGIEVVDLAPATAYAPDHVFSKDEADALIAQYGAPVEDVFERDVAREARPAGSGIGKDQADALIAQYGNPAPAQADEGFYAHVGGTPVESAPATPAQPYEISGNGARGQLTLGGMVSGQVASSVPQRFTFTLPSDQDVHLKLEAEGETSLSGVDLDLKVISESGWTEARLMQIGNEDTTVRLDAGRYEMEVSLALGQKANFILSVQPTK